MSADSIVEASSSGVSVDWGALARRFVSYPLWGAILSVVGYVELVGEGIGTALTSFGAWLADLVGAIFNVPLTGLDVSGRETIAFVEATGVLGVVVGVLVAGLSAYALVAGIGAGARIIRGRITS